MTIFHGTDDLLEESPGVVLGHFSDVNDVIEQFALEVFDDHDDVSIILDDVVEFDDVGMPEETEIFDFSLDAVSHLLGQDFLL